MCTIFRKLTIVCYERERERKWTKKKEFVGEKDNN